MQVIIGIDPGVTGAICVIDGDTVTLHKMPEDVTEIRGMFPCLFTKHLVMLEKVHSSPQQGVSTAFKFGRVYGQIEGICTGLCMDIDYVTPLTWQRGVGIVTARDKKVSLDRAKVLFPDLQGLTQKTADAALIAYYGWVKYGKSK